MLLVGAAGGSTEGRPAYPHSRRQHAVSRTVQPWFSNPAAPPRLEGNAKPGDPTISVTTARDKLQLKKGYRRVKVSSARTLQSPLPSPASCWGICTAITVKSSTPSQGSIAGFQTAMEVEEGDGNCQTRSSESPPIRLHAGRVKLAPSTKCFGELKIIEQFVGPDTAKEKLPSSRRYERGGEGAVLFL